MGGPERVARQHESGRLTARERIAALVEPGSWFEVGLLAQPEHRRPEPVPADAIVTGYGRVGGRLVAVAAIDATVLAGTTAPVGMRKQDRLVAAAVARGIPMLTLSDADGGRMPDVLGWRFAGLPFDFHEFLDSSSVPRLCAVMGPSFGDAALHAAAAHVVVMTRQAAIALSGPPVVEGATGAALTDDELGGPDEAAAWGRCDQVVEDDEAALRALADWLGYLPDSAAFAPPSIAGADPARDPGAVGGVVPAEPRRGYDMRRLLEHVFDAQSIRPWRERYGAPVLTSLARLEGRVVGVVASQPMQRAGALDPAALDKEAAFVDLCDTFSIPLVFLHDVPGLLIGVEAERARVLEGYRRVAARIARATVPKVGVVVRKSYGGGNYAMGGRPTRPDFLFAWPGAELGFMAPETGARTVNRRRLRDAADPEALLERLTAEWRAESEPWQAAANLYLDDVIDPAETRSVLARAIEIAWGSRRPPERGAL